MERKWPKICPNRPNVKWYLKLLTNWLIVREKNEVSTQISCEFESHPAHKRGVLRNASLFLFSPYTIHPTPYTPLHARARDPYYNIIYRCWLSAETCSITYFPKTAQNTPKIPYFVKCVFSIRYKESAKKVHFFCRNIWSIQKKTVPLHSLLRNKCVSIFYRSPGH